MLNGNGYKVGNVGYSAEYVWTLAGRQRSIGILNGRVYDLTDYINGAGLLRVRGGNIDPINNVDAAARFMDQLVVDLFQRRAGEDVSKLWDALKLDNLTKKAMMLCLDNLFYVGDVDSRNSVRCKVADYLVLVISCLLASVIAFKFFAALQFATESMPENPGKFVICQIPAYTEDEESLRRTIDSAARHEVRRQAQAPRDCLRRYGYWSGQR